MKQHSSSKKLIIHSCGHDGVVFFLFFWPTLKKAWITSEDTVGKFEFCGSLRIQLTKEG
jgi:hypothetical protein